MDYFKAATDTIMKLLAIDSVQDKPHELSPFGEGVGKCLQEFALVAKSLGYNVHNEQGYYVTADIGEGEKFAVLGHLDVVPHEDDEWSFDPLGEIKDSLIYGRGIMDDKGPLTLCLYAVRQLLDEGYKPKYTFRFFAGGNEESGWQCVARYNEKEKWPSLGFSPDADFPVIYCEKGLVGFRLTMPVPEGLETISGGTRVNVVMSKCRAVTSFPVKAAEGAVVTEKDGRYVIEAQGVPAHASTPSAGVNASWAVLKTLASAGGRYAELARALCDNDGSGLGCKVSDDISGALTSNVGVIGVKDGRLEILVDMRYPVTYTREQLAQRIEEALDCTVEVNNFHDPHYVDPDSELVRGLLDAYNSVTGDNAKPIIIGGGTYARAIKGAVGFGPGIPGKPLNIHQKDESVSLADLETVYRIYYEAFKRVCFEEK